MRERDERNNKVNQQDQENQENQENQNSPDVPHEQPFWNMDEEIGEGVFFGCWSVLRLKAHVSEERYSKSEGEELVPLTTKRGTRIYVLSALLDDISH